MRERLNAWAIYFAGVAIALWVAAAILYLIGNQPNERLIALGVIGAVLFGLYVYARPTEVRDALTGRTVRYGANTLIAIIAFVGIVGLLNYLGNRYNVRWDVTANQAYTLSPLTANIVQGLKDPVTAVAFYSPEAPNRREAEDRLRDYTQLGPKFTYKFIDPYADPAMAKDFKVPQDGVIVLERGTRRENVFGTDESSLTNALLKVSQETQSVIYFVTGHGEHTLTDTNQNGYARIGAVLEAFNYKTATINLKTVTDTLPSDLSALVIAGPVQPYDPAEVKRVQDYITAGGRVYLMFDPQLEAGFGDVIKNLGLVLRNDMVIDPKLGFFGRAQIPVVNDFQPHTITKDLVGIDVVLPGARSVNAESAAAPNRTTTALFATSELSWGETDFEALKNQKVQLDVGADTRGPLNIAYAVEIAGEKAARVVVMGNSTFVANGNLDALFRANSADAGNLILFRNVINWLTGQENLIAIQPKTPTQAKPIILTAEQDAFVKLSSVALLPMVIVLIGVLVWIRRR
ncbi:MAG: GldG family protein [Chloroflexi bacterium]|nr:GldG family protein [Chloroflexota bacterium]